MKPTAFSYAEYSKLQIDMERKNEYVNALIAENKRLQKQLDAAVEDMKLIADKCRETVCDDGICGLCKFDAEHGLDGYANECPGFESNECFEWRGKGQE